MLDPPELHPRAAPAAGTHPAALGEDLRLAANEQRNCQNR